MNAYAPEPADAPDGAPAAAGSKPLRILRAATAELHAQLDQSLPLARPEATLADYVAHLERTRDWLAALSPWLSQLDASSSSPHPRWNDPDRLHAIAQDLQEARAVAAASGRTAPAAGMAGDSGPAALPDPLSYAWGVAYVVEGSQLGGQFLYRRLRAQLAPHSLHYLAGRGAETASRWRHLTERLEQAVVTDAQIEAACAGAVAAFRLFAHPSSPGNETA